MKAVRSTLPTAVLVGRANVGKSTLFNRLTETKAAIVSPIAGTTRDRKEGNVLWRGATFRLIDTGGLDHPNQDEFEADVHAQVAIAIAEADVVLFVVDLQTGALPQDRQIAEQLATLEKPVLVVGNKADRFAATVMDADWYHLPVETPRPVSAIRGNGLGDVLDAVHEELARLGRPARMIGDDDARAIPHIAIVGIPNVGKSSIVNQILGEERFLTSPTPHTTREASDVRVLFDNREYIIIDTAGVRRKARVHRGIEKAGVDQSLERIRRADIAVLVLDATAAIDAQEQRLARLIGEAGVGCVIAANKWDLVEEKVTGTVRDFERHVYRHLPHVSYAPLLTLSAKERQRIHRLFPLFDTIMAARRLELNDEALTAFLRRTVAVHQPARGKGVAHPKILSLRQLGTEPPTFELVIKGRRTDVLHPSYLRFLEHRLREAFGFVGTPIVIKARTSM